MARNVYGLDLGTYDIKIFDKKKRPHMACQECNCHER